MTTDPACMILPVSDLRYKNTCNEVSPWVCIPEESHGSWEYSSHQQNCFPWAGRVPRGHTHSPCAQLLTKAGPLAPLLGISHGKHTEKTPLHEPAGQPLSLTEGGRHDFFKSTIVSLGVGMKFSIKFCMMERLSLSIEFSWIFLWEQTCLTDSAWLSGTRKII